MKRTLKSLSINISPGNIKTGKIPAVSLPPVTTCRPNVPCAAKCYALKSYKQYPNVRTAWDSNRDLALNNMGQYFDEIDFYLEKKKPEFFRWHVSGDILSRDYLVMMGQIAIQHPDTSFLCFTKQYEIVNDLRSDYVFPANLQIVFSAWSGLTPNNPHKFPVAFCDDGSEPIPASALKCPGLCDNCGMCWQLGKIQKDVVFKIH